ncbi:hypothetical protein R088_24480 [Salmonella enterica subsp. enterica serovar Heidelberg]|nr:hypothetical protein [Salmonella enterica subsp. enterica serovar Heidelberg]EEK2418826.1 hypothetical protein [Salmonella enterica subsp. enterica serovar Heidelberg]EGC2886887.1 hypothetical protein [Salmonella enterica subsp. enterica serovar Give]EGC9888844.1 hypothetical protein [Salmonella enterica]
MSEMKMSTLSRSAAYGVNKIAGRDPIQIAAGPDGAVVALCADRSVWRFTDGAWQRLPEIPEDTHA